MQIEEAGTLKFLIFFLVKNFKVLAFSIYILLMSVNWPNFMAKSFMTQNILKNVLCFTCLL